MCGGEGGIALWRCCRALGSASASTCSTDGLLNSAWLSAFLEAGRRWGVLGVDMLVRAYWESRGMLGDKNRTHTARGWRGGADANAG